MVYCKVLSVVILSIALIAAGVVSIIIVPTKIREQIRSVLTMDTPTSVLFKGFQNTTKVTDVYMSYYIWNVTNPYDVTLGAMPVLQELGPYTYLQKKFKKMEDIQWHPNATVSYTYTSTYEFRPELSKGSESDPVCAIDMGLMGAIKKLNNPIVLEAIMLFSGMKMPFLNVTAGGLIWGYNSTFLATAHALDPKDVPTAEVNLQDRVDLSSADPAKPSAAYTGGAAADGLQAPPSNSLLAMTQWNGMRTLPFWNTSYANMLNGTDGTSFSPGITSDEKPYVFVDTLYRSVLMSSRGSASISGVDLIQFTIDPSQMLSQDQNPDNAGFYMKETGFITRPPMFNQPVIVSKPHFLGADMTNVRLTLKSLPVDDEEAAYDTFLDVEPNTGQLFEVHKRLQLNIFLESYPITNMQNVSSTYFPIAWIDQHAKASSSVLDTFKKEVQLPLNAARYAGISGCALGTVLLIGSLIYLLRWLRVREWEDAHPEEVRRLSHYSESAQMKLNP